MLSIREAREADLPVLVDLERTNMRDMVDRLNPEPWSDEECIAHLSQCLSRGDLWVLDDGNSTLGHYCCSPMKNAGWVSLDSIQVAPEMQGQGYGAVLLKHFIERARNRGFQMAALNVHEGNPAKRLYERFGFTETGRSASHIRMEAGLLIGC